jgi:hypothetical protein
MKNCILNAIFFLLTSIALQGQVVVSGKVGYGFYSMSELKSYQQARLDEMTEIPAQIVDDFPAFINFKAFILFPRTQDHYPLRWYYGFQTTGSRISLTDYSGKLTFDMTVNGHMLGMEVEPFSKVIFDIINFKGYICFGTTTSFLKMKDNIQVGTEKVEQSYLFCSHGLDIEPGLKMEYNYRRLGFGLSLGYLQDINMTFYMKGSPKTKLGYSSYSTIHPNWAGLRTGIEISFDLSADKKRETSN